MNLTEAFKALEMLNEETFKVSDDGIEKLKQFRDDDDISDEIEIIDTEAETEEELQDSYVGKVILDCAVCHSKLYKNKDEVVLNDDETLANVDEECPYCHTPEGFKIIGEVAEFESADEDDDDDSNEVEEVETEDEEEIKEEGLKEGIFGFGKKKKNKESEKSASNKNEYEQVEIKGEQFWYFPNEKVYRKSMNPNGKEFTRAEAEAYAQKTNDNYKKYGGSKTTSISSSRDDFDPENSWAKRYKRGEFREKFENNKLKEGINDMSFETDDTRVSMTSDESGRVTVTTEPVDAPESGDEVIEPISAETESEIGSGEEEVVSDGDEEFSIEGEEVEAEVDEIDDESFDELGEAYLKKVYENVESYSTTSSKVEDDKIVVEGVITFKSGAKKRTSFMFEAKDCTRDGNFRIIGENLNLKNGKSAYSIRGKISNKKFVCESLRYRYTNANNKSSIAYVGKRV